MKKFLMIGAACASAIAAPAAAQTVTGTITITGTVAAKCSAIVGGAAQSTFGETVNLGELSQADGSLRTSASLATDFGTRSYRVLCNSANPTITVDANPLVNATAAPAGYDNTINYTASVTVQRAGTTAANFTNTTTAAATGPTAIGAPLAATGNNIAVTANAFSTPTAGSPLVAGSYTGNIIVTITPA